MYKVGGWADAEPSSAVAAIGSDDGTPDDDFYKQTNVNHCNACGNQCSSLGWTDVSEYYCQAGTCHIKACSGSAVDANNTDGDGCECTPTGAETCVGATLGVDDDCDGEMDEDADASCGDGLVCRNGFCQSSVVPADSCDCASAQPPAFAPWALLILGLISLRRRKAA